MEIMGVACAAIIIGIATLTVLVVVDNRALRLQIANLQNTLAERNQEIGSRFAALDARLEEQADRFAQIGGEIARAGYANITSMNGLLERLVTSEEGEDLGEEEATTTSTTPTTKMSAEAESALFTKVLAELSALSKTGDLQIPDEKLRLLTALGTLTALHSVGLVVDKVTKLHLKRSDELLAAAGVGEPSSERAPKARQAALQAFVRGEKEPEGSLSSLVDNEMVEMLFDGARFAGRPDNDMPTSSQRTPPEGV